jgi:hypothetical protein
MCDWRIIDSTHVGANGERQCTSMREVQPYDGKLRPHQLQQPRLYLRQVPFPSGRLQLPANTWSTRYAPCRRQVYRAVPPPSPKTAALPAGRLTSIYDYTNSTCSKCYCDYGCLPCRYAVHKVCPKGPLRNEVINGQRSDRLHFQRVISRNWRGQASMMCYVFISIVVINRCPWGKKKKRYCNWFSFLGLVWLATTEIRIVGWHDIYALLVAVCYLL